MRTCRCGAGQATRLLHCLLSWRPYPLTPRTRCAPAGSGRATRFDYVARFVVAVPILSFQALWTPEAEPPGMVELSCVQTTAIQQYSLDPGACCPPAGANGGVGLGPPPEGASVAELPAARGAQLGEEPAAAAEKEEEEEGRAAMAPAPEPRTPAAPAEDATSAPVAGATSAPVTEAAEAAAEQEEQQEEEEEEEEEEGGGRLRQT